MISLKPTDDMMLVRQIAISPDIWNRFSDGVTIDDYVPSNNDQEQWLLILNDNETVGIIYIFCETTCSLGFHPYMLKAHRRYGREMVKLFYDWFLKNIPESYCKINGVVPECFKSVINFAFKVGFTQEGINRNSYRFNGKIYNQVMLGITREEVLNVVI